MSEVDDIAHFTTLAVVAVLCVAAATATAAAPGGGAAEALRRRLLPALQHEEVHDERGQYALRYVTAEGTVVSERGRLVPTADSTDYVLAIDGEYTFLGADGKPIVTSYSSGPDGFKADGDHIPKTPNAL